MSDLWPHQLYAIEETLSAIARAERRICLSSPTGGGKTRIACELIDRWLDQGARIVLYTNRRLMVDQLSGVLQKHGISHGIRAAGHDHDHAADVQVSSIQTENARVMKGQRWGLYDATHVLIDEAHLQVGEVVQKLMAAHLDAGACYIGLTATPCGIGDYYSCLIQAGTNSELRACGALVPAIHYGPDEPDLRHIGKVQIGEELTEKQQVKAIMREGVFGRVYDTWIKHNPEMRPTILFAPGVPESLWFAKEFWRRGISAAHLSGEEVWINGHGQHATPERRDDVLRRSRDGSITVLCNRYVLREGIDAPWLQDAILACVFGSPVSYLQSGGRLLRKCPLKYLARIYDHGGNWWRHGSLNADRLWSLDYTPRIVSGLREDRLRDKDPGGEKEPFVCPRCSMVLAGWRCPCGFEVRPGTQTRNVIQTNGQLIKMPGPIFRQRDYTTRPDAAEVWKKMYFRARNAGMTFRQAEGLFAQENNWGWPPRTLPLMPKHDLDWFKHVSDVPRENLT